MQYPHHMLRALVKKANPYISDILADKLIAEIMGQPPKFIKTGPNPCGEIPLGPVEICHLSTGKLSQPHTTCQRCGEVVNAIGEDKYGYIHPLIHTLGFRFNSGPLPMNPSRPKCEEVQAEDRLHRPKRQVALLLDDERLLENVRNKKQILEESLSVELSLTSEECLALTRHLSFYINHDIHAPRVLDAILVKLTKMESKETARAAHQEGQDRLR